MAAGAVGLRPVLAQDGRIRLLFWGGQDRADRTYGVSDLFESQTGAAVDGEFLGWGDYWTKLGTQTAGGNAPDVMQMDYRYIVEYATRGAIAPLDEFVGEVLELADFDADQIEGGRVNDQLYGISLGANSVAMLNNLSAFEQVGIDPPDRNTTYADWREMGEAFNSSDIGMKALSDGSGVEPMLDNWLRQQGLMLYTADGELGFGEDEAVEWFRMWQELREADIIVSAEQQALDTGGGLEATMVVQKLSASMPSNSNQLVAYQSLMEDDLSISSYPRIEPGSGGGHYRKPSMFFSVAGSSSAKETAARFVNFFVNDVEAAEILGVERGIPCAEHVREALAPQLDEKSRIALEFVANLDDLLGPLPPPPPPAAGEIDSSLLRTISQEIAFGARSPEDGGRAFVEGARDILSRASS
ncbi:ABC transporter ATP-binding protein [Devosia pacifica]|uniref:ABC transporter ATP-binding protein n=2 Tax=Devosia pacifica TaxID=1335967 RepID=A0A918S4P6_9HYPH|nr:ABC transporter ATP-binding protein [Devosia pacifica]